MRSLSNFLLFENVLDNLDTTNPLVSQITNQIFTPTVKIIQANCGTQLGKKIDVDLTVNGLVRMDWNGTLNPDLTIPEYYRISKIDIQTWLGNSIYTTYVRDLHSCTSIGGICSACYAATLNTPTPAVGTMIQISNRYVAQIDSFATTTLTTYTHSVSSDTYDYFVVYLDNHPLTPSEYSSDGSLFVLTTPPSFGQFLTIKYIAISNKPFLNYVSKKFSGDLIGIESVSYQDTFLPLGVIDRMINTNQLDQIQEELQAMGTVDQIYLDYCNTITNKIERAIILLILFTMYSDVLP